MSAQKCTILDMDGGVIEVYPGDDMSMWTAEEQAIIHAGEERATRGDAAAHLPHAEIQAMLERQIAAE